MKVTISKAIEKEIKNFEEKTWRGEDIEHYGKPVRWIKRKFIFKATENGKIIGTVKGKFVAGVIFVETLIVAKDKRERGVGRKLMERVEEFGKQFAAHKIFLFTMEEWQASKFYEALGFKKTGKLLNHYLKRDFVIYSKLL